MNYLLVQHKVADYATWKAGYDEHAPARDAAELAEVQHLRSIDDPNDVVLLFSAGDLTKAQDFVASEDLRQTMDRLGVIGPPDICFLS